MQLKSLNKKQFFYNALKKKRIISYPNKHIYINNNKYLSPMRYSKSLD